MAIHGAVSHPAQELNELSEEGVSGFNSVLEEYSMPWTCFTRFKKIPSFLCIHFPELLFPHLVPLVCQNLSFGNKKPIRNKTLIIRQLCLCLSLSEIESTHC